MFFLMFLIREDIDRQVFGYSFDNECFDWVKVKKGEFKSLFVIIIVVQWFFQVQSFVENLVYINC